MIYQSLWHNNYKNTTAYKYYTYLNSPEWKEKRTLVLNRDHHLCQRCRIEPALDVHHLTYKNLYNEPLEDLQALCRNCHAAVHSNNITINLRPSC
ncbi:HNH endonuclease [Arcticibacter tournemirensis]|uniref:HNH endonuclease n=1 Tax=Arcticibacter tournemirensis TaxID=699437 RepID=A0A5M9GMY2_9SPHI|nr:HNH endonuclease [Arcticibacter tournemirensis]